MIETEGEASVSFLLDCGQFQGSTSQEAKNFEPFPFNPAAIDFLILSHAHVDHCGRIPLLVKAGFKGRIYCTAATADLLPIILRDCAHIHEKDAEWKNRKGQRAGKEPVEPLYTTAEAEDSFDFITPVLYDQEVAPAEGIRFTLLDAGHILGSAITEVRVNEGGKKTKLVYTGDLGVDSMPLLRDPVKVRHADVVIMETTYGARTREKHEPSVERLSGIIEDTIHRGGTVLIPSFAVGRTQELIYDLSELFERRNAALFRNVMVYVDSPMATAATGAFRKNIQDFDAKYKELVMAGDDPLDFTNLEFTHSTEESKTLNANMKPKVIISASGMCEAGRILHHLKHRLWDSNSTVAFVGFQAEGTLGRRLIDGAKTVSVMGEAIDVNAKIVSLEGFSAHADRDGLLEWVQGFDAPPETIFLVHGEAEAKAAFKETLKNGTGIDATVIDEYCCWDLGASVKAESPAQASEGRQGRQTARADRVPVDPEDAERLLEKLRSVNDNVEGLLYRAKLAAMEAMDDEDEERYISLKNLIVSLESDTSKLAGALADRRRGH